MYHAELKLTNICTNTSTRSSQQVVGSNSSTVATAAAEGTVKDSLVTADFDSKATTIGYTTTKAPSTTEPVMKTKAKSVNVLQINTVPGADTAVTDAASSVTINKNVSGVKGIGDVNKAVQDVSADKAISSVADSQGSAKQSSVVAATAVGTSIGKRKGMTLSIAPLATPVDIHSGAGATGKYHDIFLLLIANIWCLFCLILRRNKGH
jgi:hypothetical protein